MTFEMTLRSMKRRRTTPPFDRLPDHILLRVLAFLPQNNLAATARVCWRWRRLSRDPSLWREVVVPSWVELSAQSMASIVSLQPGGLDLSLLADDAVTNDTLRLVASSFAPRPLHSLCLKASKTCRSCITDEGLEAVAAFPITRLNLNFCTMVQGAHLARMAGLVELNLVWCSSINETTFLDMASHLTGLRVLDLSRTHVTDAVMAAVGRHCSLLEALDMLGARGPWGDSGVAAVASGCPSLTTLGLRDGEGVSDVAVRALAGCHTLHMLSLNNCRRVTGDGLRSLARSHSLTALDISRCSRITAESFTEFVGAMPGLRCLILSFNTWVTNSVVKAAALPSLHRLFVEDCYHVDDDACIAIASRCPELMVLSLALTGVTNDGVSAVLESCRWLSTLDVTGAMAVTYQVLCDRGHQLTSVHTTTDIGLVRAALPHASVHRDRIAFPLSFKA